MTARYLFASLVFGALAALATWAVLDPAQAQDDSYSFEDFMAEIEEGKKDQALCRDDDGGTPAQERSDACTRLIEDAPVENDLVGTYYVNRAMADTSSPRAALMSARASRWSRIRNLPFMERTISPRPAASKR